MALALPSLFLSSTALDLAPFREAVIHVCQRLGISLVTQEDFGPDPRAAAAVCKTKVEGADLFLGLYAHRYGFQPDGFGGTSITQLEYEWALARRPPSPVLLFLVDEEQAWLPKHIDQGEPWTRLQTFKSTLRARHVVSLLTTPDQLKDDLFVHLPKFCEAHPARRTATAVADSYALPQPPEPYAAHWYTLLQTGQVIGRQRELERLNGWVKNADGVDAAARVLCLVAIGGMGKSALTWKWFNECAAAAMVPLAGRFWWSFYESDAGFDRFVTAALAYCSGESLEASSALSSVDREARLLALLDRQPFLLVLDGLERLLVAYSSLDFAHLSDEDLDARTANAVATASGLPSGAGESFVGQHRLRKTIDPRVGNFLRKLTRVRASRLLVTTRLYPSELQTATGFELPGAAAWFLRGLDPADALALWRAMSVTGSDRELNDLFKMLDYYPLLIRALAGEVAGYRRAPGDFDAWRRAHHDFDPFSLPLVQVKSHVLAHALEGLTAEASDVLRTIASFRSPVDYDTLTALFVTGRRMSTQRLDAALSQVEDRGLLGWDRATNRYDLHPIVRGVVWRGLDHLSKSATLGILERHFSAIGGQDQPVHTLAEATPVFELFHALVGLDRRPEAASLYFDRIHAGDFSFAESGTTHLNIAMLESLFPAGLDAPPDAPKHARAVHFQLAHAYRSVGRPADAESMFTRGLAVAPEESDAQGHSYRSEVLVELGRLREAHAQARRSVEINDDTLGKYHVGRLAMCEAVVGDTQTAVHRLQSQSSDKYYEPERHLSRIALWQGDPTRARELAQRVLNKHGKDFSSLRLEMTLVVGLAAAREGATDESSAQLEKVLRESRAANLVPFEIQALCALAEGHLRTGQHAQSRECLDDVWETVRRSHLRLLEADALNLLAALEHECGNVEAARVAATSAYRCAWCDGPSHTYHSALESATRLLNALEAPLPGAPR